MRKKFFTVLLLLVVSITYAQTESQGNKTEYRHFVGVQINPYLSDFENISTHFEYGIKGWIFSARYGYCLNKNFCVGADFSGYYYNLYYSDYSWQILHTENYNFGAFARYSVDKFKKFKPFVESGAYYFIERGWTETPRFGKTNLDKKAVSGYIGFGARFPLFKDRFSLDVMYKYHDIGLEERSHHSVTYRFNFHF